MTNYIGRGPLGEIENILRDVLATQPLKYRGVWQPDTFYNEFDVVQFRNSVYVTVSSHRSGIDFIADYEKYDRIATFFTVDEQYDPGTTYLPGDTVQFNGAVFQNQGESTGIDPTNTVIWREIISDLGRQQSDAVSITGGDLSNVDLTLNEIKSNIIPDADITYDIGSDSRRFRDLYLSGNTIKLDDVDISKALDPLIQGLDINLPNGSTVTISDQGVSAGNITTNNDAIFTVPGNTLVVGDESNAGVQLVGNTEVTGNLDVIGDFTLGGNITFGDSSNDTVAFNANFSSSITPDTDNAYDIGAPSFSWRDLYVLGIESNTDTLTVKSTPTLDNDSATVSLYPSPGTITFGTSATSIGIGTNSGTTTINNDLSISQNLDISGSITSNVLPETASTLDLGSTTNRWTNVHAETLDIENISITGNSISAKNTNGNVTLTPIGTGVVNVNSTTALVVPGGTEAERNLFTPQDGSIRFNSDISQFEGYQGSVWTSLGGVKSVDGETLITAELTPGAGDDTLRFFTNGNVVATLNTIDFDLDASIDLIVNSTTSSTDTSTGSVVTSGGLAVGENVNLAGDINVGGNAVVSGNLTVNGTTTTVNSTTLSVDDKNIELASTDSPSDVSADGGGITIKGSTDKTIEYTNATQSFTLSENLDIANSKTYRINAVEVLSPSKVLGSATNAELTPSATTLSIGASTGTTTVNNQLDVTGTGTFSSTVTVTGSTDLNNSLSVAGVTSLEDTTESTSTTTGSLIVAGGAGIAGNVNIGGDLTSAGSFTAADTTLDSLTVTNNTSIGGTVTVSSNGTISGTFDVAGDFAVNSTVFTVDSATGNTDVAGTLGVTGATSIASSLDVTQAVTLNSTLAVSGQSTFSDTIQLSGSNTQGVNQFVITDGTNNTFVVDSATGNTTIEGTLGVTSTATFSDDISVTNQATVGTLSTSSASFSGIITSTVADGTAPLSVTSTTLVDNLNADRVDGYEVSETAAGDTVVARNALGEINVFSIDFIGEGDGNSILRASSAASGTLTLPAATDVLVGKATTDTFTNKTISLTDNSISGTTAEFNTALTDDDFATVAGTETLTNKTIDLTENSLFGTLAEFNAALSNDDFVSLTGSETLTNKTITDPTINSENGVLVLPTSVSPEQTTQASVVYDTANNLLTVGTGTNRNILVDTDSSQELTNKTLTSPVITGVSPSLTLSGDVTGTATFTDLGDVTLSTTIEPNSVALGTDTTGDYVQNLVQGTGVTITNNSGETATPTIEIGQNVATDQNVTFAGVTAGNLDVGVSNSNTITTTAGDLNLDSITGTTNVNDDLIITGNLTVQGTTTTVDSTVSTIVDPIISLGGTSGGGEATSDDGKDRGINFKWNNGAEQNGFFGFDDSTGYFTFVPQATITNEVISGSKGDIEAGNFRGNLIGATATLTNALSVNGTVSLTPGAAYSFSANPANTGSIDNINIGATTAATGDFTNVTISGTTDLTGLLTANGGIEVQSTAFTLDTAGNTSVGGTLDVLGAVTLTNQLTVPNGGTGITSATLNGVLYGNGTSGLGVTAESDPGGNNANTSNGVLTTDASNVPVWTDTIDGGTF